MDLALAGKFSYALLGSLKYLWSAAGYIEDGLGWPQLEWLISPLVSCLLAGWLGCVHRAGAKYRKGESKGERVSVCKSTPIISATFYSRRPVIG